MKVYAVAEKVPEECGYLTAGKRYAVLENCSQDGFRFVDDAGRTHDACWVGSAHINGNWQRIVEEDDVERALERAEIGLRNAAIALEECADKFWIFHCNAPVKGGVSESWKQDVEFMADRSTFATEEAKAVRKALEALRAVKGEK